MRSRLSALLSNFRYLFIRPQKLAIKSPTFIVMSANFIVFNMFVSWLYYNEARKVNLSVSNQNQDSNTKNKDADSGRCSSSQSIENQEKKQENLFKIPQDIRKCINKSKMVLVMDLDETMVFTRRKKQPTHKNFQKLIINDIVTYVQFRPHIAQFLAAVSQMFTIYVYTAGTKQYADPVLNLIPNSHVITKRFYRDSCIMHKGNLIKDLKIIKKNISVTICHQKQREKEKDKVAILVDDNGLSISYNQPHAVRIRAFEGNQQDKYLEQIFKKLLEYYRQHCPHQGNLHNFGHGINLGGGQGHGNSSSKLQGQGKKNPDKN